MEAEGTNKGDDVLFLCNQEGTSESKRVENRTVEGTVWAAEN